MHALGRSPRDTFIEKRSGACSDAHAPDGALGARGSADPDRRTTDIRGLSRCSASCPSSNECGWASRDKRRRSSCARDDMRPFYTRERQPNMARWSRRRHADAGAARLSARRVRRPRNVELGADPRSGSGRASTCRLTACSRRRPLPSWGAAAEAERETDRTIRHGHQRTVSTMRSAPLPLSGRSALGVEE